MNRTKMEKMRMTITSLSETAPAVTITEYLEQQRVKVDEWLDRLLPTERETPAEIHQAMRYSTMAGGKRLRPILTIATAEACGLSGRESEDRIMPAACALEMIHTYSLIHDDLPAMDNDDLRRGRPTCHVVFGEAMAILAGDALLTQAFRALADDLRGSAETKVRVISEVAQAAGTTRALIGGQVLDIQNEGRQIDGAQLAEIHRAKTGALIRCAVRIGAIIGGATETELQHFTEYGEKAGLAFQIADDVLDATATSEQLGKTAGKDAASHKATYATIHGLDVARQMAAQVCDEAVAAARRAKPGTRVLEEIARFIIERKS
ncbi:MAG TPA: farnesyl diphosphate synthase [Blastocatellia bacterium]|nr:farnesyl diphosphate synthase [Blastocatellia bacterium]